MGGFKPARAHLEHIVCVLTCSHLQVQEGKAQVCATWCVLIPYKVCAT